MSVKIVDIKGADVRTRQELRRSIKAISKEFPEKWILSLRESGGRMWSVDFEGPDRRHAAFLLRSKTQSTSTMRAILKHLRSCRDEDRGPMLNRPHTKILQKGVLAWNRWRKANPKTKPNLSGAYLYKMRLDEADLTETDLTRAYLAKTSLRNANLSFARLCGATLRDTNLSNANLIGADFSEAVIVKKTNDGWMAHTYNTTLKRTDLSHCRMGSTKLASIDLTTVRGLETVRHHGASAIDVEMIFPLIGKLPEVFLRGAGIPEGLIVHGKALISSMDPIQFYSCFISYSSKDQIFVERLHADLQAKGVRCWFAAHDATAGEKLHEQIDNAIRVYDRLLLILSHDSMHSDWVNYEIANARRREIKEQKKILFPIRLVSFEELQTWDCFDADARKDTAKEIREYLIPDFSDWKQHDSYVKALDQLIKGLKCASLNS